ncbi:MAG TPA: hypothetical protein VFT90_12855, partial [Chryseosolibacter sp.]|nr:hypothetical protein [Chryseosolibacter sp.]
VNGVRYPLKDEKKNAMAVVKVDRADRNGVRGRGEIRKVTASPDDLCNSGRVSFTRLPRRRDGAKDRGGCDMVSRFRRQRFALHINRLHLQVEDFVMAVKFWALARAPARLVGLKPGENSIPRTTS